MNCQSFFMYAPFKPSGIDALFESRDLRATSISDYDIEPDSESASTWEIPKNTNFFSLRFNTLDFG